MVSNTRQDGIAIIGAGPGGLAAAVLLAARGCQVTVYEANPEIGGRTGRLHKDGFTFDLGPTFFLMPHVLQEIFREAGRDLFEEVELRRLDPMYRLVIGQQGAEDVVLDACQDTEEMSRRIGAISPEDGRSFRSFIAHNRKKLDAAEPILRRPIRSTLDLVRPDAIRTLPLLNPHLSVHDLNSKYFSHPAVRLAVGFQSKYLGMAPMDCPSLFTILPYIEYEYGVWHPVGGCHALMRALARVLIDLGGTIRTGTPVESLEFEGDRVRGVRLGGASAGDTEGCDYVVMNADATWAMKNLIPQEFRGRETDERIDRKKYSCSTFMLYLGVEGEVDLPHHTIRTAKTYEQNLEDISRDGGRLGTLSGDPSYYICNPTPLDPSSAPAGCSSLYVLMPTPNTKADIDWESESAPARERLLDRIESDLGLRLRDRIRVEQRLTPDDWARMNINHGATFNLAHSLDQMLHKRPQNSLPGVENVCLVGGGTHPGSGLPVIFLSAQIAADMIADRVGSPFAGRAVASDGQPERTPAPRTADSGALA